MCMHAHTLTEHLVKIVLFLLPSYLGGELDGVAQCFVLDWSASANHVVAAFRLFTAPHL